MVKDRKRTLPLFTTYPFLCLVYAGAMPLKWILSTAVFILFLDSGLSVDSSRDKLPNEVIPCDRGWYYFDNKCYKLRGAKINEREIFEKAVERCKERGGDLVSIHSQAEQDFITTFMMLKAKFWTWNGLSDRVKESQYTWSDGTVVNFTYWRAGEPSGPKEEHEDCTEMLFTDDLKYIGVWNDISCSHVLAYICEKEPNNRKKSPNPQYCSSDAGGGWKYQSSCYHVVSEEKSWEEAEAYCQENFNGHLAKISDKLVDMYLNYILSHLTDVWIGIKIKEQFQQKWTSGWYVSYNGFKDYIDFKEGTCVVRKGQSDWAVVPCDQKNPFVCEVSTDIPPVLKPPPKGSYCPTELPGWRDLGGDYCYYIATDKSVTWQEANFECLRRGGALVSLHSKEESAILLPFVRYTQGYIYIGLYRTLADEEVFAWTDGSDVDYIDWNHDEPNNEDEKCSQVRTYNMKWDDVQCHEKRGYICSVRKIIPNSAKVSLKCTSCEGSMIHFCWKPMVHQSRNWSAALQSFAGDFARCCGQIHTIGQSPQDLSCNSHSSFFSK